MTNVVKSGPPGASRSSFHQPTSAAHRLLVALELMTAVAGITGGVLLIAAPDGSLLHAGMSALHGTPFSDWRVPGVLLLVLVGGGFLLAGFARVEVTANRYLAGVSGFCGHQARSGVGVAGLIVLAPVSRGSCTWFRHHSESASPAGSCAALRRAPGGRSASTIALDPAGWVRTS